MRRPQHAASCSSRRRCRTRTARSTSATSWSTSRPTSGCASSGCRATRCTSSAPTTRTARRSCCRADAEGITPQALVARIAATRPKHLAGFHLELRPLALDRFAGERRARRRTSTGGSRHSGLIYAKPVEQFYDPVKAMFLPDRYIKGSARSAARRTSTATPARTAARPTRRPISSIRTRRCPARRRSCEASEHLFFRLSAPAVVAFLREWTAAPAPASAAARGAEQDHRNGSAATAAATSSPTGTSRATRRTSAFRFPTRRASISTSGSTRRSATSRASRRTSRQKGIDFAQFLQDPARRPVPLHRQGHRLLPHAVLAGDAEVRRRAVQGADQRVRPRLPHRARARRCRSRAAPASAPTSTSTSASTPNGCATTSPPSSTTRSRTSTSTPTTSSRASTAIWSAST